MSLLDVPTFVIHVVGILPEFLYALWHLDNMLHGSLAARAWSWGSKFCWVGAQPWLQADSDAGT